MSSRTSPRCTPNSTNSSVPYGSSLRSQRLISCFSLRSVPYAPISATRLGTQSSATRWPVCSSQYCTQAKNPRSRTSFGASSQAGSERVAVLKTSKNSPDFEPKCWKIEPFAMLSSLAMSSTRAP